MCLPTTRRAADGAPACQAAPPRPDYERLFSMVFGEGVLGTGYWHFIGASGPDGLGGPGPAPAPRHRSAAAAAAATPRRRCRPLPGRRLPRRRGAPSLPRPRPPQPFRPASCTGPHCQGAAKRGPFLSPVTLSTRDLSPWSFT